MSLLMKEQMGHDTAADAARVNSFVAVAFDLLTVSPGMH